MNLSQEERDLIKSFVDQPKVVEAVKRVLLKSIYEQGGIETYDINFVFGVDQKLDDATYGRQVRTVTAALSIVRQAFDELHQLGQSNPQPSPKNEAR